MVGPLKGWLDLFLKIKGYIVNTGTLFGVSCRVSRVYGFMGLWGFIAVLGSV